MVPGVDEPGDFAGLVFGSKPGRDNRADPGHVDPSVAKFVACDRVAEHGVPCGRRGAVGTDPELTSSDSGGCGLRVQRDRVDLPEAPLLG